MDGDAPEKLWRVIDAQHRLIEYYERRYKRFEAVPDHVLEIALERAVKFGRDSKTTKLAQAAISNKARANLYENLVTLMPDIGRYCNPMDLERINGVFDYIEYQGASEGLITGVYLVDIKRRAARANPRQQQVQDAIESGRFGVKYATSGVLDDLTSIDGR